MDKIQVPSWEIIGSHRRAQEITEKLRKPRKSRNPRKPRKSRKSRNPRKPRKFQIIQKSQKIQKVQKVQKILSPLQGSYHQQWGCAHFMTHPPCESKIKLSVIRILSLSFAPFWQYPLFLLQLNHVSAADRSACSAADFDVVCHLLGEFHFLGLVEGHCAPYSYCSCSYKQEGSYHSRTLIDITLCFHGFYFFILFIICFPF